MVIVARNSEGQPISTPGILGGSAEADCGPERVRKLLFSVPLDGAFRSQATATRIHAFLMSIIDGRRSIKDMAKLVVEQRLMTAAEAEPALRSFFIRMHDDARRGTTY